MCILDVGALIVYVMKVGPMSDSKDIKLGGSAPHINIVYIQSTMVRIEYMQKHNACMSGAVLVPNSDSIAGKLGHGTLASPHQK